MAGNRRQIAPYLSENVLAEVIAGSIALVGFLVSFLVEDASDPKWAFPLLIGLLFFVAVEQLTERILARTRSGRLQLIESALTDVRVFDYVHCVVNEYSEATARMRRSPYPALYDEVLRKLLDGQDWKNLSQGRLEVRNPTREVTLRFELLQTVKSTMRAVAVPNDFDFLESELGRRYLRAQQMRIDESGARIERLFVYWSRAARELGLDIEALEGRASALARAHSECHIRSAILNLDNVPGVVETPDSNLYDSHSVRFSTFQLVDSRMQSIISEDPADLQWHEERFRSLWALATTIP